MKIMGLDLSLTSTGVCNILGVNCSLLTSTKGDERLMWFDEQYRQLAESPGRPDLIVLEGYAYGRPNQAHQIGELGGVVRLRLRRESIPYVTVPPSTLKKYATGKGNASKDQVLIAAVKRSGIEFNNNDEADAWWLRQIGMAAYGGDETFVDMPADRRDVVLDLASSGDWPFGAEIECSHPAICTDSA